MIKVAPWALCAQWRRLWQTWCVWLGIHKDYKLSGAILNRPVGTKGNHENPIGRVLVLQFKSGQRLYGLGLNKNLKFAHQEQIST